MGLYHRWFGDLDESSKWFRASLDLKESPEVLALLADNHVDKGEKSTAIQLLEQALKLAPGFPAAYQGLALLGYYQDDAHEHIVHMRTRLNATDLSTTARRAYSFAVAETLDKASRWDEAIAYFQQGHSLSTIQAGFSAADRAKLTDQLMASFGPTRMSDGRVEETVAGTSNTQSHPLLSPGKLDEAAAPSDENENARLSGKSLVFVVGMPRCGSTLVEQILASHPEVHAGGERSDVGLAINAVCQQRRESYPLCFQTLTQETILEFRREYLARVQRFLETGHRFVDKYLENYLHIGLIAAVFPEARIVHCHRNALDTCVSCYCKYLVHVPFAHDWRTLGLVYREYERLMVHWEANFPGRILHLRYESLTQEPEKHIRRLLAYCDLPWNPACMRPHEKNRSVCTASAAQVKSPIHTRSVERWKNYEKHLGPLIEALGERTVGTYS